MERTQFQNSNKLTKFPNSSSLKELIHRLKLIHKFKEKFYPGQSIICFGKIQFILKQDYSEFNYKWQFVWYCIPHVFEHQIQPKQQHYKWRAWLCNMSVIRDVVMFFQSSEYRCMKRQSVLVNDHCAMLPVNTASVKYWKFCNLT